MVKKYLPWILLGIYILVPFDIIPDWIIGGGWLDDAALLGLLIWLMTRNRKAAGAYRRYTQYGRTGSSGSSSSGTWEQETRNHAESDPYVILGINRNASKEEIKAAYQELAGKYHPDRVQHLGEEFQKLAHEKFIAIQNAYDTLMK